MKKTVKRLAVFLLALAAVFAVNAKKADAAYVSAMAEVETEDTHFESHNGQLKLKFDSFTGTKLPDTGEFMLKLSGSGNKHYLFSTEDIETHEIVNFRIVAGHHYIKDGFLSAPEGDTDVNKPLPYYAIDKDFVCDKLPRRAFKISAMIPANKAVFAGDDFYYGAGTAYETFRTVDSDGTVVYTPNCFGFYNGVADDGNTYGKANGENGHLIKVKSQPTALTKVSAAKKAFTANWKKVEGINGYQIQYSLKKNFKSPKNVKISGASAASKKVTKLKKKKVYYVRVRTYKTLDGVTGYSSWSAAKKVKTK